jgi:hypothetical protein
MAITTEDGIAAGLKPSLRYQKATFTGEAAGQMHNLFAIAGRPGAGAFATPGLAGATVDDASAIGGMFPFDNPASGNAHLAKLSVSVGANIVGFHLYDLLWYNSGLAVTTTTAQTINSVTWPARDRTGTTNGADIEIWLHAAVATTNAALVTNTTYSYTNSDGTASRTAGLISGWPATAVAGTVVPFGLQGSDRGVRSIQTLTLGTSYGAGTLNVLAVRQLCFVPFVGAVSGALLDWAQLGLPQLYNDSAIYMAVLLSGTAAGGTQGDLNHTHG